MKIKDILKFNRDAFFDGAVQIDWYYDEAKRKDVSKSYVFHGKDYHGVERKNLIDTASYVKRIVEKLYNDKESNRFLLTIAGYGTGKSHLGVTLATLLGEENNEREIVLNKIKDVDNSSYDYISKTLRGKNLVLTLNGMNDFNLNYQMLKVAKLALKEQGINDSFLEDMTKAYEVSEHFVEKNYEKFEDRFKYYSKNNTKYNLSKNLKKELLENLKEDIKAFNIINEVYKEITSNYIKWDEGVSAGEIINKLNKYLCIENNLFENIIILFDEFGRFIEYAGAVGTLAGESGLQQMFEAIQNSNKNVMFIGLIQSDLNAYLTRVENSNNIIRYVGRYETSEKLYISSNLETILANLINKKDEKQYELIIGSRIDGVLSKYYNNIFNSINRWLPNSNIVWKNESLFNKIIAKGTYPLNPLTVWLLCNSSDWMQQRSTLTFAEEIFEKYSNEELFGDKLVQIYPTELIESKFFNELLGAEEKGIQNSQHCIMYKNIITQYEEKLSKKQLDVLRGILISNIGKFKFFDKADNLSGIEYITGIRKDVDKILKELEDEFGIISYDSKINRYEFISTGSSINDYKKTFFKYKVVTRGNSIKIEDPSIRADLSLDEKFLVEFSQLKGIKTQEWNYEKFFIDINELTEGYIKSLISRVKAAIDGEKSRGIYLWVYCDSKSYNIDKVKEILNNSEAFDLGIIVSILNDAKDELKDNINKLNILNKFNKEEKDKYNNLYKKDVTETKIKIVRTFTELASKRAYITKEGLVTVNYRSTRYCNKVFSDIYTKAIPFMFDGFDKKPNVKAKNYYKQVIDILITERYKNRQAMLSVTQDVKNRFDAVLREDFSFGWGVFDKHYLSIAPKNNIVFEIIKEIIDNIEKNNSIKGFSLLNKYMQAPYGLNLYQINLIMVYILVENKNIRLNYLGKNLKRTDLAKILKDKLNLEIIFKCEFLMNEMNTKEKLDKLVKDIEKNKYPELCSELYKKLKAINETEDIPVEMEDLYYNAEKRLEDGMKINIKINEELYEIELSISNLKKQFDLIKLFKVISDLQRILAKELGSGYEYSDNIKNEIKKIDIEIREVIRSRTPRFIEKLDFNITEISIYKERYLGTAVRILKKLKEDELANNLSDKINKVIERIEREEAFRGLFNTINELRLSVNTKINMKFTEIRDLKNQLSSLKNELEKEDMPNSIKNTALNDVDSIYKILIEREEKQLILIENIKILSKEIDCNSKLDKLLNDINKVLDLEIICDDIEEIKKLKCEIEEYKFYIREIKGKEVTWNNFDVLKKKLLERYRSSKLLSLIEKNIEDILNNLKENEEKWKKENIYIDFSNMSLDQCINWQNKMENIPSYISNNTLEIIKIKKEEASTKIAEQRVEGVIAMFNRLTNDEKRIFLSKINK